MLYNILSENELERAIYIDPANTLARAEMLRRVPALLDDKADELKEAEAELATAKKDFESEITELEEESAGKDLDIAAGDTVINGLTDELDEAKAKLAAANVRIASLTFADDLV